MQRTDRLRRDYARWLIDLAVHDALAVARKRSFLCDFQRLLAAAVSRSNLLRPRLPTGAVRWSHVEDSLRAVLALCAHRRAWIRSPAAWAPTTESPLEQLGSLAGHLLATHSVPAFMTRVWLEEPSETARRHQTLFKHLARGHSVRGADVPLRLTKPMAAFFLQAPAHFTVEQALRYGQVRGLGGSEALAGAIVATHLGSNFEHEHEWREIVEFLVRHPGLDGTLVGPMIGYLRVHRGPAHRIPGPGTSEHAFRVFLERVRCWQRQIEKSLRPPRLTWPGSGLRGYESCEAGLREWSVRRWRIVELTDSASLSAEGALLHHCVGTYAELCAKGESSIWSMRRGGAFEMRRELTIEVDPKSRRIVTALGRRNSRPRPEARRIMEQ